MKFSSVSAREKIRTGAFAALVLFRWLANFGVIFACSKWRGVHGFVLAAFVVAYLLPYFEGTVLRSALIRAGVIEKDEDDPPSDPPTKRTS